MLDTWNDGETKSAIVDFVRRVTTEGGPDYVEPSLRGAVFDNDGTLWCEKQPYKAADGDLKWFGEAATKHYEGDDSDIKVLGVAVLSANVAISTEEHAARVDAFFAGATDPTRGRPYMAGGYVPMVELLRYLEANGFACYIVSGGGRDFMRPVTAPMYGIPPERVVGSSVGLIYQDGSLVTTAEPEVLDDGPVKPVRIWGRIGRGAVLGAGDSKRGIPMVGDAPPRPGAP